MKLVEKLATLVDIFTKKLTFSSHFRYFFLVFTGLILLGLFNGLIFLPVLLALVGPPGEVIPKDKGDSIAPPTPEVQNRHTCSKSKPRSVSNPYATMPSKPSTNGSKQDHWPSLKKHHQSDLSLSTIAEESGSYASSMAAHQFGGHDAFPMTSQSLNGASVVVEPVVDVEISTYPSAHVSTFIFHRIFTHKTNF